MKTLFLFFSLHFLCSSYSNIVAKNIESINLILDLSCHYNEYIKETNNSEFDYFLEQFDLFKKEQLDKSFFKVRKQRETEKHNPELSYAEYSSFIPYDNQCNCEKEEFYYRPCYRIETANFHLVNIQANCDIPIEGYPFSSDILVTYNKAGEIIDYEIIGSRGDLLYYKREFTTGKYEINCTQYYFYNINSGECDASNYKVIINDDGTIDKQIIRNYTDNITISID